MVLVVLAGAEVAVTGQVDAAVVMPLQVISDEDEAKEDYTILGAAVGRNGSTDAPLRV